MENIETDHFKNWFKLKYLLVCTWRHLNLESFTLSQPMSLADIELPVYQNAHVNSVWEKLYSSRCLFYFQCSTVNIYKYKGKYLLRRIAHGPHGNFNPFVISNKQAHIINGNIPVTLRCVMFFSHTTEPLRTINTFLKGEVHPKIGTFFSFHQRKASAMIGHQNSASKALSNHVKSSSKVTRKSKNNAAILK